MICVQDKKFVKNFINIAVNFIVIAKHHLKKTGSIREVFVCRVAKFFSFTITLPQFFA